MEGEQHNEFGFPRTKQFEPERQLETGEIHNPNELVKEWARQHDAKGIVCFGEDGHHGGGTLNYEIDLISDLASNLGIKRVFLEEDRNQQRNLDLYYKSGKMLEDLKRYLKSGFVRLDSKPHMHKLKLVEKCRELGVPITFVGSDSDDERWSEIITENIGESIGGVYLLIAGSNHVHRQPYPAFGKEVVPTGFRLQEKYGREKILSLLVSTYRDNVSESKNKVMIKYFEKDLKKLGRQNEKVAVKVYGSPYEELLTGVDVQLITKDAYDILISVPGEDLARYPYK